VGNLPAEVTSFVDRRGDLAEVRRLLSTTRLVTLTGVAGVGKTRLALRVAAGLERAFAGGVWLVELAGLRDGALVAHTVAQALGMAGDLGQEPLAPLAEFLKDRQSLLVLDNCEHVVDSCAAVADTLLRTVPRLRILATSREALRVAGEHLWPVEPLAVPPSVPRSPPSPVVELFADRATAVLPSFEITAQNEALVLGICRRLDGIPLAIELAATRLKALSLPEIAQRLDNRFRLLASGRREVLPRQRTLRAAVDWSFELCTPAEQVAWARASVFAGGFGLAAAEEICRTSCEQVYEPLAGLVGKSVLIREEHAGEVRLRLLETLREYGQEILRASGQETALRQRHAQWCLRLVERAEGEWFGPDQVSWFRRLQLEHANVRTALDFCLTDERDVETGLRLAASLWFFWGTVGLAAEGRHWLQRALESAAGTGQPHNDKLRAQALWAAGYVAMMEGDSEGSGRMVDQAAGLASHLGDIHLLMRSRSVAGNCAVMRGDLEGAAATLLDVVAGFNRQDWPADVFLMLALIALAGTWMLQGDLVGADQLSQLVCEFCAEIGDRTLLAYSLYVRARCAWLGDQPALMAAHLHEIMRLRRELPNLTVGALCVELLAWVAGGAGDHERAAVLLGGAQQAWHVFGSSLIPTAVASMPHRDCEARSREALGDPAFEEAFARGRTRSTDNLVLYALGERNLSPENAPASPASPTPLTRREQQVAGLVAQGMSNKLIAGSLVISQRTAEAHVERILQKLGFSSRAQIAAWVAATSRPDSDPAPQN
jgi:predicted ATPase/DNA-binding CsgD family transcriptional regulator